MVTEFGDGLRGIRRLCDQNHVWLWADDHGQSFTKTVILDSQDANGLQQPQPIVSPDKCPTRCFR